MRGHGISLVGAYDGRVCPRLASPVSRHAGRPEGPTKMTKTSSKAAASRRERAGNDQADLAPCMGPDRTWADLVGESVFQFDLALQVVLPADLAVRVPQPQRVLSLSYSGRFGRWDLGWCGAAPCTQAPCDQDAGSHPQGKGQQDPQKYPGAHRACRAHHSAHGDLPFSSGQDPSVSIAGCRWTAQGQMPLTAMTKGYCRWPCQADVPKGSWTVPVTGPRTCLAGGRFRRP